MAVPVVLDTSVVVKLFIEEPGDKEQIRALLLATLQDKLRPVVPDFLLVEFANIVWLKLRSGNLAVAQAETALTDLEAWSYEVDVVPFMDVMRPALHSALRYDHAVYDMAFLALAEQRQAPFLTADRPLYLKICDDYRKAFLLQAMSVARLQSEVLGVQPGTD